VPATGKSEAHRLFSEVEVNPDGSVIVPSSLISRIAFHPLNHDFSINFDELALMGVDKDAGEQLNEFIKGVSLEVINEEAKNYKVISENEREVSLLIPSNPSSVQAETSKMKNALFSIVGNRADLVEAAVYEQLSHLTAGFGTNDRLVHLKTEDDGSSSYEIVELDPGSTKVLADANAKIDDYKRVALQVIKFKSKKVPDRLKHLFAN
jgi:hypothetical protein